MLRPVRHPEDLEVLHDLFEVCHAADGHWPLGEHKYLSMMRGDTEHAVGVVAEQEGAVVGYAHLTPSQADRGWSLEMAVHPLAREDRLVDDLLEQSLARVAGADGRWVRVWVFQPGMARRLTEHGFAQERELRQLRRALPLDHRLPLPAGIETVGFRPGLDEDSWLALNNLAFAGHPENGGWTSSILADRLAQPWFDPAGLLMAWSEATLAGFCWTKVHDEGVGEIYVIAVSPGFQGRGLGTALVAAGLDHLAAERACSEAMLYVDAANRRALDVYQRLGFWVDHIDRSFTRAVDQP